MIATMPYGTVAQRYSVREPNQTYADSLMRWFLPALTFAVLAACLNGAAKAGDAQLPPANQPPLLELPRQDIAADAQPIQRDSIPQPSPEEAPPLLSSVQREAPQRLWKEPIGTRVDYNPYSQSESPTRRFNNSVNGIAQFVPGVSSVDDRRKETNSRNGR